MNGHALLGNHQNGKVTIKSNHQNGKVTIKSNHQDGKVTIKSRKKCFSFVYSLENL